MQGVKLALGVVCTAIAFAGAAPAQTTLKASHQWPGGKGDARDEMMNIIVKEVAAANVGLTVQVFPGQSLFKAREQWGAVTKGELDLTLIPLDYAAGRHPQFSATLMPGLVRTHERAGRLNDSPFMQDVKAVIADAGAVVLADAWLSGAFASKSGCIGGPETVKGKTMRAAGPMFETMLAAAGASIASMPSSEIYTAMQTGVLDAVNTSSESFVSFRLYEQVKCLTAPGANALWFMYQPVLMSKQVFDSLTKPQQDALMAAGQKAEEYFVAQAKDADQKMVDAFKKAGVEIKVMSQADFDAWMKLAETTSFKKFDGDVKGGKALLQKAMAVK